MHRLSVSKIAASLWLVCLVQGVTFVPSDSIQESLMRSASSRNDNVVAVTVNEAASVVSPEISLQDGSQLASMRSTSVFNRSHHEEDSVATQEVAVNCKDDEDWVATKDRGDGKHRKRYWPDEDNSDDEERNCAWVKLDKRKPNRRCKVMGCSDFKGAKCRKGKQGIKASIACPSACRPQCQRPAAKKTRSWKRSFHVKKTAGRPTKKIARLVDCTNDDKWVATNARNKKRLWDEGNEERNCAWVMLDKRKPSPRCNTKGCSEFKGKKCKTKEKTTAKESCPLSCNPQCKREHDKEVAGDCKNNKNWVATRLRKGSHRKRHWPEEKPQNEERNCDWVMMDKRWPNPRCNVIGCTSFRGQKCTSPDERTTAAQECPEACFAHCKQ